MSCRLLTVARSGCSTQWPLVAIRLMLSVSNRDTTDIKTHTSTWELVGLQLEWVSMWEVRSLDPSSPGSLRLFPGWVSLPSETGVQTCHELSTSLLTSSSRPAPAAPCHTADHPATETHSTLDQPCRTDNLARGVARILHWGATEAERQRCENRGAKGVAIGERVSLSSTDYEVWGASWGPQQGLKCSPGR